MVAPDTVDIQVAPGSRRPARSATTTAGAAGASGATSRTTAGAGTLAGLAILLLVVLVVIAAGSSGGGGTHPVTVHAAGLFTRIQTLSGNGAGSFAGVETAAENAAINRTLAYTPAIRVAGSQHREVALTFDDGPGPYTQQVVSLLDQLHVPATFFEVGVPEQYFSAGTSDIVAHGYPIEDHTWSHAPMAQLSPGDQRSQLLREANGDRQVRRAVPEAVPSAVRAVEQPDAVAAAGTGC